MKGGHLLEKDKTKPNKDNFIQTISNMSQKELNDLIKEKGKKPKRMCGFLIIHN